MLQKKKMLIVIAGPTASGKTELSIELAKKINGDIISGDSMQIYKYLDIGTAKIKKEEMQGINHHLIDIIEPREEYNVRIFQKNALKIIDDIYARGKIPIIAGGTGLYIDALVYNYSFIEENNNSIIRDKLWEEYYAFGNDYLVEKLKKTDPDALEMIDLSNTKRLIRAIEICENINVKFSELERNSRTEKTSPFNLFYFVITMNRNILYDKINRRVHLMFENGWLDEVNSLLKSGVVTPELRSMQGIGYRQILDFLDSEYNYDECVEKIKQETRRFAKRQLTWFRKNKDVIWLDKSTKNSNELLKEILDYYKEKLKGGFNFMSKGTINFQDVFLSLVRKENRQVVIYMVNKFQLKGYVKAFDNFVVILENEIGQQMIYKHAISTISPIGKTDVLKEIQHTAGEQN